MSRTSRGNTKFGCLRRFSLDVTLTYEARPLCLSTRHHPPLFTCAVLVGSSTLVSYYYLNSEVILLPVIDILRTDSFVALWTVGVAGTLYGFGSLIVVCIFTVVEMYTSLTRQSSHRARRRNKCLVDRLLNHTKLNKPYSSLPHDGILPFIIYDEVGMRKSPASLSSACSPPINRVLHT